jgi:hypothetical protein
MKQAILDVLSDWKFLAFLLLVLAGLWYLAEPSTVLYIVASVVSCGILASAYIIFTKKPPTPPAV